MEITGRTGAERMENTRTETAVRIGYGNANNAQQRVDTMAARMDVATSDGRTSADAADMIELETSGWAAAIAADCTHARSTISVSAISMMPPLRRAEAGFCVLWDAWVEAAQRGVNVTFHLPAPMRAHPATARNVRAAKIAQDAGMHTRFAQSPRLLHAKSVVVDGCSVWIGSGNMTSAAAISNHEFYVHFNSFSVAERIESYLRSITTVGV